MLPLDENKRKTLDSGIKKMLEGGASQEEVTAYAKDFNSKYAVKKKDSTQLPSSQAPKNSELPSGNTSLAGAKSTQNYNPVNNVGKKLGVELPKSQPAKIRDEKLNQQIDSEYPVGSIAWSQEKMKANVPGYTSIFEEFKNKEKVDGSKKQKIIEEVEQDSKNEGLWNNLRKGAGAIINPIFRSITEWETPKNADERPELIDYDPLKEEKKIGKEQLQEENRIAKINKRPEKKITQESITERAKKIAIEKRTKSLSDSQVKNYMKSLEDYAPEKKQLLTNYRALDRYSISEKDKLALAKKNIALEEFTNNKKELNEINSQVKEMKEKGLPVTQEIVNTYNSSLQKYNLALEDVMTAQKDYASSQKELGSVEDNLDIFKRDYDFVSNLFKPLAAQTGELIAGGFGAIDYVNNISEKVFGQTEATKKRGQRARQASNMLNDIAKELRSEVARPTNVDDIHSLADYGDWFFDNVLANQGPILGITMLGNPGIAGIGISSTGTQFEQQKDEIESGTANYSDSQMIVSPALFGVTEALSSTVTEYLIGNATRVFKSATSPQREIIDRSIWNRLAETSKKLPPEMIKSGGIESFEENGTSIIQDINNKYYLGKKDVVVGGNSKDISAMSFTIGALLPFMGGAKKIAVDALSPYTTDSSIKKLSSQILAFEKELLNPELEESAKKIISDQARKKSQELESKVRKIIKDIESMSDSQFQEIIRLEKAQANIKSQAEDIQLDDNLSTEMKEQLLNNLKAEFKSNENRRVDLVQRGGNSALLNLEDKEIIRLKNKASRELMKEKNPDGTKSLTLKDAEITQRAGQILTNEIKSKKIKDEAKLAEKQQEQQAQPQAEEQTQVDEVNNQDFDLYHTSSNSNLTIEDVSVEPRVTRQGRKGKYGGLYAYDNIEDVNTFSQGNNTSENYGIRLNDGVEITEYNGPIERLDKEKLEELRSQGIQVIKGKSLLGKTEIIVIDKSAIKSFEKINKNEATPIQNTPADGNIQSGTGIMAENGTAVQENNTAEDVSETADARPSEVNAEIEFDSLKKGDPVEITINGEKVQDTVEKTEDGAVFLKSSGVWRTKSGLSENPITKINQDESNTRPETESLQEDSSVAEGKSKRKSRPAKTEKNLTKPSMRGKTPLDKRKIKDKSMLSALNADTVTPYDAVQQFFIGGGRVLTDDIKALLGSGEEARLRQQYARTGAKGGQTIDAISDKLWQEYGAESGIDQMEFKNAIEDVIKTSLSTKAMAENFNSRNGINSKEEGELIETPYGPMTQEQLDDFIAYEEMRQLGITESESQHQEAISYLETLTDEEMTALAEENELAFNDMVNELEKKEADRDYSEDSEVQSMGISMRREGRDATLSKGGPVKELNPFRRKWKRLWNRTFKSNAGLHNSTGEVIRSRDRDIANYTDGFNAETTEFKKILNNINKKAKDSEDYRKKVLLINDYMAGADVALSFINSDEKAKLDYMRGRIDNFSDGIIGILEKTLKELEGKKQTAYTKEAIEKTKMLIETIKSNKEKYINRTYQIFTDESYREAITQPYENLNKEGKRRIDNVVEFLVKKEGFTEDQARSYVAGYLDDIKRAKIDVNMASKGKAEADFLKKRKDLPIEFQELLGVSNDPIYNYVHTVFKLANYLASVNYQEKLRTNLLDNSIAITEPKQGYTKLTSDSDTWKVLSDLYVPNDIKEAMDDMMPLERINYNPLNWWIKLNSMTKVGKTILNPTGTFRNFLSGNFLGLNSGHFLWANPKNAYNSMHQAWGTEKSRKELGEFRKELIAEGIVGEGGASGEMLAYMNDFSKPVDRLVSNNPLLKSFDFMQKAYAFGDDFFKVGGYVIEKNRLMSAGIDEKEARRIAGERNRGGYPTYSYLPKNFQELRKFPLTGTFVSFPYEVIRSTKNNAMYAYEDFKAGRTKMASQRVAGMVIANALPTLLSVYSMGLIGFDDEDDDALRNMLPDYQKDSIFYYTGKEDGKPTFIDLTVYFPSEVGVKPLRILMEERAGRTPADKVSVAIGEVIEPYVGIDLSTKTMKELFENEDEYNKKIYDSENLIGGVFTDPVPIANYYLKKAGPGVYSNITEFARANEVNPEFFGEKNTSYGKEYTNQDALWGFFGFRFSTVNYDNALSNYGKETKEYLKENRSKVGKGFNSTVPLEDEKVKELVTKYVDKNDEIYSSFINSVNSGEKLGMTKTRIAKSLKQSGFKKEDIMYLLNDVPPATPLITKDAFLDQLDRIDVNNKKDKALELKKTYLGNVKKFNREIERQNKERLKLFLKEKKEKDSD